MNAGEMYPSTLDCEPDGGFPPMAGGAPDWILGCLQNARGRVAKGHSVRHYAESLSHGGGQVCAMGALYLEVGVPLTALTNLRANNGMKLLTHLEATYEEQFSEEAKTAINMVSSAALELHPEAEDYGDWAGPLEWVNQMWVPEEAMQAFKEAHKDDPATLRDPQDHPRCDWAARDHNWKAQIKAEILRIYDHAIEMRQAALVH